MKAVLVLNGEPSGSERLKELAEHYPVYVADGGAKACLDAGVHPEIVVGDFDSFPVDDLPATWNIKLFLEQDRTDFQKLLSVLPEGLREVVILGGMGKRLDHTLTNLLIASEIPDDIRLVFEGEGMRLNRITPSCGFRETLVKGTTVSLLPLCKVEGVTSKGLTWNLDQCEMGPGLQLGQSNRVEERAVEVTVRSGELFIWIGEPATLAVI